MPSALLLSVVVPVRNEEANILPLVAETREAVASIAAEVVYVDDGSTDDTGARQPRLPLVWRRHMRSFGQSAAACSGVCTAVGTWIATLDGDGRLRAGVVDLAGNYRRQWRWHCPEVEER